MFKEINNELEQIVKLIEIKSFELNNAREKFLLMKASYENSRARYLLEEKAKNTDLTQSELNALATNLSHADRLEFIKAESSYRRLVGEIKALRDRLDVAQEISYNLRRESQI